MIPSVVALAARGTLANAEAPLVDRAAQQLEVTLGQEIAMLGSYVGANTTQERERRSVQIDVSPGAMEAKVPTLFLQLLVENVMWQMRRTGGGGTVQLSAERQGSELHLGMHIVMPFHETSG